MCTPEEPKRVHKGFSRFLARLWVEIEIRRAPRSGTGTVEIHGPNVKQTTLLGGIRTEGDLHHGFPLGTPKPGYEATSSGSLDLIRLVEEKKRWPGAIGLSDC